MLKHHEIVLKIFCDDEYEKVIKNHFKTGIVIKTDVDDMEIAMYNLFITNSLYKSEGVYSRIVDDYFDFTSFDCWINNSLKECYITNFKASSDENRNLTIKFFVDNLFNRLLEHNNYIGVHASCVEKFGRSVLFVGERLAGKTTSMLTMLNDGYNLISNDYTAIKYLDKEGYLDAFGINNDIFIRMSKKFSSKDINQKYVKIAKEQNVCCSDIEKLQDNRIMLSHYDLAKLNGVEFKPSGKVELIIFPRYVSGIKEAKFTVVDMSESYEKLFANVVELLHDSTEFLENVLLEEENKEDRLKLLCCLNREKSYICEYNEDTKDTFVSKINELLGGYNV